MYTYFLSRFRRLRADGERGSALVLVIGIAAVLSIVVGTGLTLAQSATAKSGSDRNAAAAMAAAYAGVADYAARLTNDNTYVDAGDPSAPFSANSTGLVLPSAANPALCYGETSSLCTPDTWAPVPGATGNEAFRYEVNNAPFPSTGTVQLLATGRSGDATASVRATIRQDGFLNYVYFTNYETMDPALLPASKAVPSPATTCTAYEYAPESRNTADCGGLISFLAGETINGAVRSNDALNICGGTFTSEIETADPNNPNFLGKGSCSSYNPVFEDKAPQTVPVLNLPSDNTSMVAETASTDPNPGCMYTGPTAITFNSNATMTVVSPWTKSTYSDIAQASTNTQRAAECGTPGASGLDAPRSASDPTGGETLPVPNENLIYVQDVPVGSADPNYWGSAHPTLGAASVNSCTSTSTGVNDLGYPWTSTNNSPSSYTGGSTYPTASAPAYATASETVNQFNGVYYYSCTDGDAFITGELHGQVTVAAQHYVYATGNLSYTPGSNTDLLGIDGQQAIWVWNPAYGCKALTSTTSNGKTTPNTSNDTMTASAGGALSQPSATNCAADLPQNGRTINAALMSVADTFQVQNYNIVGNGTQSLTVNGAIVENFRGTVGEGGTYGFSKNYNYDSRLASISPPRFQTAVAAPWSPIQYSASTPAFTANGAVE